MQELKEIAEWCIDGGWLKDQVEQSSKKPEIHETKSAYWCVDMSINMQIKFFSVYYDTSGNEYHTLKNILRFTPNDLLSSHPAMEAIFPGDFCEHWREDTKAINEPPNKCGINLNCGECLYKKPWHTYHIQQAFTLPTDKERVEYVHRVWKGEK